jgi:anti-repressor protein
MSLNFNHYGFIENEDFFTFDNFIKRGNSANLGTKRKEYLLKIDTAKEISMIENNEKGRQIRSYLPIFCPFATLESIFEL